MIRGLFIFTVSMFLFTGMSLAFTSSSTLVPADSSGCSGIDVGSHYTDISVNDSLEFSGVYCARSGGFSVEERIDSSGNRVNVSVKIGGPGENEMAAQVITPVEFNVSEDLERGDYDLSYEVEVENEVVESGEKDITVENDRGKGFFVGFRNWFSGLF